MRLSPLGLLVAFILLTPSLICAQKNSRVSLGLETIDAEDIYAYINYLASDGFYGRNAGTQANDAAAEWIARFFKDNRLKPGGDNDSFLQEFEFRPSGAFKKRAKTWNVVGVWEGTDLKGEALVVGAHFDHVGKKSDESNPARFGRATSRDFIWNGADDNASGSAVVMEVAQAFAMAKPKTRRSIVFVLFSAEEHGLYGSRHYTKNPYIPLDQTRAMVNIDMVGRNKKRPIDLITLHSDKGDGLVNLAKECSTRTPGKEYQKGRLQSGSSDHASFVRKGIPSICFHSGLHKDLHQISDEVDKIDCQQVAHVSKTVFLLLHRLANMDEPPAWNGEPKTRSLGPTRKLGIKVGKRVVSQELEGLGFPETQGAVRVKSVSEDSVAANAGLQEGDLILRIDKVSIRKKELVTSLDEAVQGAPAGMEVPLEILRKNKILLLSVKWEE